MDARPPAFRMDLRRPMVAYQTIFEPFPNPPLARRKKAANR
ncbi:MAG: hypothetical protein AVDCRST_MAG02-1668 [uncultured Rubrobacteraceae bacterium]|uniref:Uncharacterized protein n=1 Tax=uncultured Rubrobacteraceae bacterium TaxID=349277 RepID=A0A6J4R072_9ACTN|nr:MAG: hypothetical protein AVDCRST_MAG02-1668 [uncultured Rubrobacteraceae bacterium]